MTKTSRMLTLAAALIWTAVATAHEGKGPHGGRLADTGTHHVELVITNDTVEVFVSTHNNAPIQAADLRGLAIVVANGASTRIPLAASNSDPLTGTTTTALPIDTKGVVRITLADGKTIQATFD